MKKMAFVAAVVLLSACAAPQPQQLNLHPSATLSSAQLVQGKTYALTSKDLRTAQYVALIDNGHANVIPMHSRQNLRVTLEETLAKQFNSQGFAANLNSENNVELDIEDLLVNVKHSVLSSDMEGKIVLTVIAETPRGKLTKTFTGTAKRSAPLSASDEDITRVVNDLINMTLEDIGNDKELRDYMKENF